MSYIERKLRKIGLCDAFIDVGMLKLMIASSA